MAWTGLTDPLSLVRSLSSLAWARVSSRSLSPQIQKSEKSNIQTLPHSQLLLIQLVRVFYLRARKYAPSPYKIRIKIMITQS
jgi:hypothetical protein